MKKIVLSLATLLAMAATAHAEDSCSLATAGEGQKLACVQSKFDGKVAQLKKFSADMESQIQKLSQERAASDNDKAERAQRLEQMKMALKGVVAEIEETKNQVVKASQSASKSIAKESRILSGRADDSDTAERAQRSADVKSAWEKFTAEVKETAKEISDAAKALIKRISNDDND